MFFDLFGQKLVSIENVSVFLVKCDNRGGSTCERVEAQQVRPPGVDIDSLYPVAGLLLRLKTLVRQGEFPYNQRRQR